MKSVAGCVTWTLANYKITILATLLSYLTVKYRQNLSILNYILIFELALVVVLNIIRHTVLFYIGG